MNIEKETKSLGRSRALQNAAVRRAKLYLSLKRAENLFLSRAEARKGLQKLQLSSWALSIACAEGILRNVLAEEQRLAAVFFRSAQLTSPGESVHRSIGKFTFEIERAADQLRNLGRAVQRFGQPAKAKSKEFSKPVRGRKKGKQDESLAIVIMGAADDWLRFNGEFPGRSSAGYGPFGIYVKEILSHVPEEHRPACPSPATIKRLIEEWLRFHGVTVKPQRQKLKFSD
jgi:hypothetical protein